MGGGEVSVGREGVTEAVGKESATGVGGAAQPAASPNAKMIANLHTAKRQGMVEKSGSFINNLLSSLFVIR